MGVQVADQPLPRRRGRGWLSLPQAFLESPRRGRRSRGSTGVVGSPGSSWVRRGRQSTRNPSSHGGHSPGGGEGGQWAEALAWREKCPGRGGAQDSLLGRPPASLKDKTSTWASSPRTAPRRGPAPGQAGAWGHLRVRGAWLGSTRGCHSWSQAPRPSPGPAQPGRAQGPEGDPTVPKDTPSPVRPARLGVWESQPPRVRAQPQAGGSLPEVKPHWAPALPLCGLSLSGPLYLWPPLLPTPSGMDKPGRLHPAPQLPRAPPPQLETRHPTLTPLSLSGLTLNPKQKQETGAGSSEVVALPGSRIPSLWALPTARGTPLGSHCPVLVAQKRGPPHRQGQSRSAPLPDGPPWAPKTCTETPLASRATREFPKATWHPAPSFQGPGILGRRRVTAPRPQAWTVGQEPSTAGARGS